MPYNPEGRTTDNLAAFGWTHTDGAKNYRRWIVCIDTGQVIGAMDYAEANVFCATLAAHGVPQVA